MQCLFNGYHLHHRVKIELKYDPLHNNIVLLVLDKIDDVFLMSEQQLK